MHDMRADQNPYAPGSGLRPPELAGRDRELEAFDLLVARTRVRLPTRPPLLHGLRGVGKTVLLRRFQEQADVAGWLTVGLEASPTATGREALRQRLARGLVAAAHRFDRARRVRDRFADALPSVSSFSASLAGTGVSLAVAPNPVRANSGSVEIDLVEMLEDLGPALTANTSALGIFVDELQDLDRELLHALLHAQHHAGQTGIPFFLIGAGLPSLPAILSEARSYAERLLDFRLLGPLGDDEARSAIALPAQRLGARFSPEALDEIVAASEGYPYFLQTFSMKTWEAAPDREISRDDARIGIRLGRDELDMGFYPARWGRTTRAEQRYLVALAGLGGETTTGALANALETTPQGISATRQSLIEKGIVFAPERGSIAFTVPGMSAYVARAVKDGTDDL